jgi:hypothetical protein
MLFLLACCCRVFCITLLRWWESNEVDDMGHAPTGFITARQQRTRTLQTGLLEFTRFVCWTPRLGRLLEFL